jgi:Flp pilus assembly protein TadD
MWKREAIAAALGGLLAATALAYLPAVDGAFLLDDHALVRDPLVLEPLGQDLATWLGSSRPVATLTFALNRAAVDFDPRGWHLTNLAIHLAAAVLAFLLARLTLARAGLSRPEGPALAAAALFALHPLQSESVAYVTQRAESLASGLMLAALLLLLGRDGATGRRRAALLLGAVALHALALLTKPIAATLPALWLLHAAVVPVAAEAADPAWRRGLRRLPAALPLLALSGLAAARGLSTAAGSGHAGLGIPDLPLADALATQLRAIPVYLRLLAFPAGQCGDWWFPASRSFLEPAVLAGGLFLLSIAALAAWAAAWAGGRAGQGDGDAAAVARAAAFGTGLFFLALLPSSVVPLRDTLAEHRVYLAALGPFLAAAAGAALLLRRLAGARAPALGAGLAALVLAVLAALTAQRAAVWTSALTFWEDAARKAPLKARAHQNLGDALHSAGRSTEALASFRRAVELMGDQTIDVDRLHGNLVNALLAIGHVGEARAAVGQALAARPGDPALLALLALVELVDGKDAEAERLAGEALALDPAQGVALKVAGLVAGRRGDVEGALRAFRAAAAQRVVDPLVWYELGHAEAFVGNRDDACAAYARAANLTGNGQASASARAAAAALGCR